MYFVRVCTPKALVAQGFPFDFKFSLHTKSRPIAIRRSAPIVMEVLKSLDSFEPNKDNSLTIQADISDTVTHLRNAFSESGINFDLLSQKTKNESPTKSAARKNYAQGYRWQEEFIQAKQKAQVTHLTVHQLNQRTLYFLDYLKKKKLTLDQINPANLMDFGNHLQAWSKSAKTKKDFWGSAKQLVRWLVLKQYLTQNPFDGLALTFRSEKFASEQREKWSKKQIKNLLDCDQFQRASTSLRWTVLLLIHMGMRPSEACQLSVSDVRVESDMFVLTITDKGSSQKLKNQHSLRTIPIHRTLIQSGFIDFVKERKKARRIHLFDWKPEGKDNDWTKRFRTQFGKIQTSIGLTPKERPTAYGFRHTFIDHLKQKGIEEYQVAEVVGHANQNMTYGRYGKKLSLNKLKQIIEIFDLKGDQ